MGELLKIDPDSLAHFGIMGMRWGRRKSGEPGHAHHEEARVLQKRGAKNLTNEELAKVNKRLQLEKTFNELNSPKKQAQGKGIIKNLLTTGKTANEIITVASGPAGKLYTTRTKTGKRLASTFAKKFPV